MIDKILISVFGVVFIVGIISTAVLAGNLGDKQRETETIELGVERLHEAWLEQDYEYLECENMPYGRKYRYPEVAALRASMCTVISPNFSQPGEPWRNPLPPLPPGFSIKEETPQLPTGFKLLEE